MIKDVPKYQKYIKEKNLCELERFILGHEHRPSESVWTSEEERRLVTVFNNFKKETVILTTSQQERFDRIKDAPTYRKWLKLHDLPWQ
jgi:hypothetical protein